MHDRASKRLGFALPIALLTLSLSLAACGGSRTHRGRTGAQEPVAIPTAVATQTTVHPTVQIAGIIAPYQNVSISSSLSEPTKSVNVLQGDVVHRGEILAVLDTTDLQATYEADERNAVSADAKAAQAKYQATLNLGQGGNQVDSAKATLQQAQVSLKQAQADYQRYDTLLKGGYISAQQVQQQQTLVNNDEQQVSSAQASLQTAELNEKVNGNRQQGLQAATVASAVADAQSAHAQADEVAAQISRATIVSPVDGVVVNRNLNPGEYPGIAHDLHGPATRSGLRRTQRVIVERLRDSARFAGLSSPLPAIANATYQGRVDAVLGQVQPGSTNFTVQVIAQNPGEKLQSGMAVTGTIDLPAVSGVGIPTAAFLDDSHTSIMIVDANDDAKQVRPYRTREQRHDLDRHRHRERHESRRQRSARDPGRSVAPDRVPAPAASGAHPDRAHQPVTRSCG